MRKTITALGSLLILSLLVGVWGGLPSEVGGRIIFGWLAYVSRVWPHMTIDWTSVAMSLVFLVLFTVGLHMFLRWFFREFQRRPETAGQVARRWSFSWTASIVVGTVTMFGAGIAATGIVHQSGWLLRSRRSLTEPKLPWPLSDKWNSTANLRMTGLAVLSYASHRDSLPFLEVGSRARASQSWQSLALPYMDIIFADIDKSLPWDDPRNSAYYRGIVPYYLNPEIGAIRDSRGYGLSHFAGNEHVLGRKIPLRPEGIANGASNTILAGEVATNFKPWGDPTNLRDPIRGINQSPDGFAGPSGTGANMIFLDGSVRFLRNTTSSKILQEMSLPGRTIK
jgi:hypothetical protein